MGKVACWSTKTEISLKRVKIEEKLLWRVYMKSNSNSNLLKAEGLGGH